MNHRYKFSNTFSGEGFWSATRAVPAQPTESSVDHPSLRNVAGKSGKSISAGRLGFGKGSPAGAAVLLFGRMIRSHMVGEF